MATNLNIQGVDISYCQQGLDYEKLKADGIKFAIIRASYTGTGSHKQGTDSLLNRHVNGCISQGIDYGFYHYSCATSVEEAKREAQYIVQAIKEFPLPKYPVFFDAEEAQIAAKGKKATTEIALAFINEVEKLGYPSGIYANPSWMETYLDKTKIMNSADIWLAHWVSQSNYNYGQKMWQNGLRYSAGMQIDSDICFVNYPQETSKWYEDHGKTLISPEKKTLEEIVQEVWEGKWGCGQQRYNDLIAAGYDYYTVQDLIEKQIKEKQDGKNAIKVGSKVKIKQGATTYTGGKLASFVYNRTHIVTELIKDRAVVSYGNVVIAAVNVNDLSLST